MATTDSKGLVLLQQTDNLTPLEGTINTVTSSVSAALNANTRIFQVANQAARDTLANSRTPTANNPLFVWRQDTKVMEYNYGTGWGPFPPEAPEPNIITISGVSYRKSGTFTVSPSWNNHPQTGLYIATVPAPSSSVLPNPPSGWAYVLTLIETGDTWTWGTQVAPADYRMRLVTLNSAAVGSVLVSWRLDKS